MAIRILTLCTGNVCRSPLAAQMLASRLEPGVFEVTSAGTTALVGDQMPEPAQRIAERIGLSGAISHRAAALTVADLDNADLILGMERVHRSYAAEVAPTAVRRTFTLFEFSHTASQIDDRQLIDLVRGVPQVEMAALDAVMRLRGVVPRLSPSRLYDIEDPYGRSNYVYERSARQIAWAVDEVVQFFDRATVLAQAVSTEPR